MILEILNDNEKTKQEIDNIIKQEQYLIEQGNKTTNLSQRYKYYQNAKSLHNIAKELVKWETTTRGY